MPSISSESTWFLGQPRVVKWTFMTRGYDPTRYRGESNGPSRNLARGSASSRLRGLADEHDDLAGAQHLHLEGSPRWLGGEPAPDLLHVVLRSHGQVVHGEDDVAAHGDLLATDGGDLVAAQESHVPGRGALGHRLDEKARGLGEIEDGREVAGQHGAVDAAPEGLALEEQLLGRVDGDHEAQPLAAPGLRDVVADDADDLTRHVEHGAAGVARVDGGRGLEEFGEGHVLVHGI